MFVETRPGERGRELSDGVDSVVDWRLDRSLGAVVLLAEYRGVSAEKLALKGGIVVELMLTDFRWPVACSLATERMFRELLRRRSRAGLGVDRMVEGALGRVVCAGAV